MAKKDFMATFLKEREQPVSKLDTVNVTPLATLMISENFDNFYNVDDIDDLVESIREHGLLHPIVTNNGVTVISGHRRLAAYRRLLDETGDEKYKMIPCIVLHPADPIEAQMMMIEANSTARILSSFELMEQAKRYDELLVEAKEHGYEYEGRRRDIVAKMMKLSPAKVGRYAAIDKNLDESWKFLFEKNEISESVAYEISKMEPLAQDAFLDKSLDAEGHVKGITLADVQEFERELNAIEEAIYSEEDDLDPKVEPDPELEPQEMSTQGHTMYATDGKPVIVGLPPRKQEPGKPAQHDVVPDPDTETEHEETLDKWRKMAEEQETAEAQEPAREQEPEQNPVSCEKSLDQLDRLLAAVPRTDGKFSPYACIGRRFKQLREERDFTRKQMSDYLGWYPGTYSAVENGDACSLDRLCEAARKLDVSLDWLVGFSDNRTGGIAIRNGRDRLTHERCNGVNSGYWSPAKKEDLIDRLAEYENAEDSRD